MDRNPATAGTMGDAATGPPLTVRAVTTAEGFDSIEETWNELLDRSEATVFQTYEWQRVWWKYFGAGKQLLILVFERNGRAEGIAPLFSQTERLFGIPVATRLQFTGVGLSDYLSVIASREHEGDVFRSLAGWLASNRGRWDVFDLEDVAAVSASFLAIPSLLESENLRVYLYHGTVCPRVALPGSEEELMKQIGPTSSQNLKRRQRRLNANFRSGVRLVRRPDDPIAEAIDEFAAIHGNRWKSQGHPSAFDDPHHRSFHTEVCRRLAKRDWLRIFFLDIEDRPVAVSFSFNFRSTIYMYQSNAHADAEMMKCSPGLIIRSAAINQGIAEGMKIFDFMRGNESYKYREWAATDVKNWLIRSTSAARGGSLRFTLFLSAELMRKATHRFKREYYEFRRYRLGRHDKEIPVPTYALRKISHLLSMTAHFIARHFPGRRKDPPGGTDKKPA